VDICPNCQLAVHQRPDHLEVAMRRAGPTLYAGQFVPQPAEARDQRVVLHALALLPPQSPAIGGDIVDAITVHLACRRPRVPATGRALGGDELNDVRAAA